MNVLSKVFIFAAGAALGSAVTWKFVETKYKKIADEEIASVKEVFGRGHREEVNPVDDAADISEEGKDEDKEKYEPSEEELDELKEKISTNGYTNYSTKKEKEEDDMSEPYVISPDEFSENNEYETESLTYYSDGVLTDEYDNPIEDIERLVGSDALTHFGEYEDDSVFVRNDDLKTDFEILKDYARYYDKYPEERVK